MPESHESFQRLLYTIIFVQFIVIALLQGAFSHEYLSNAFMQAWVQRNAPGLELLLNGGLDSLFIGAAIGATFLIVKNRREKAKTQSRS